MSSRTSFDRVWAIALGLGLVAAPSLVAAGPCDLYGAGGTPCVAAHSTTRSLYSAFNGNLYQVQRAKDSATAGIPPVSPGGIANSALQDSFCAGTTCTISIIYDQSPRKNHLTRAPPGGFRGPAANGYDNLAVADKAPIYLNGKKVYGVYIAPGTGYRNNKAVGTAIGDQPESMYAVLDGTHYNNQCCFDYGNAETNSLDTGNGHMESIYFGTCNFWGSGAGTGPWIMADLENGLFSGKNPKNNAADPTIKHRFLTATLKGQPGNWAIRGGNAATGGLTTFYNGARPDRGYNPMHNEGAIILGIGGDNSVGGRGTFYEGIMTYGFASDAVENAVQADIVNARYGTTPGASVTTSKVTPPVSTTTKAMTTTPGTKPTTAATTTPSTGGGGTSPHYGQCGGQGYSGPTACEAPFKCQFSNEWYSQCL